jgi:hypothetical protein
MLHHGQTVRVILPDGAGTVEIDTSLTEQPGGNPRHRIDVVSDQPKYGRIARDGRTYVAENQRPGVVFLTGRPPEGTERTPDPAPDMEAIEREVAYKRMNGLIP